MLRSTPPTSEKWPQGSRALPVTFEGPGAPVGEDGLRRGMGGRQIENEAADFASEADSLGEPRNQIDYLALVREAESQALLYQAQTNRKAWTNSYLAVHNQHYNGSKYTRPEYRGRSALFVPKTRNALRKDNAAVAASMFNTIDAINCSPGNESDPRQVAAAQLMQEVVNYRTDGTSGKHAIPWFLVCMGARQNAVITGVCASKQYWKREFRKVGEETLEDGKVRERHAIEINRPDMALIPPENYVIDPAADWTNPAQSAAYLIVKWPMQVDEIVAKQNAPVNAWKPLPPDVLKTSLESGKFDMASIRRARELGIDRMDETQTGTKFQIVWVYENFLRFGGEDYTFFSVGDQHYLTDPTPVREVYPEQFGERPIALGYGALEAHRIYPMSPVESWQPLQWEVNDLRNLMLDATKQNVMPITKVVRGRQIDLDQVKRRSSGSSIMVTKPEDVTWETPPQIGQAPVMMSQKLDIEIDDLAGQTNFGNVQAHNAVGDTLGGLKLAEGAANAVQEFDIRVWIETWANPALAQLVRLEQFYEADKTVLGIAGQKAQLWEKYGINQIDDDLIEQQITVRVSAGLGAGDPQQRLQKFQAAASVFVPLAAQTKEFQSGQYRMNIEAVGEEVFGAVGYKDGGSRFIIKEANPPPNPMGDLPADKLRAEIAKNDRMGKAAIMTGLAQVAKVALGKRELESNFIDMLLGHQRDATGMGFEHGHRQNEQVLSAREHGHRHGLDIAKHRHEVERSLAEAAQNEMQGSAGGDAGQGAGAGATSPSPGAGQDQPSASPPTGGGDQTNSALMQLLASGHLEFTRDPRTDRITGVKLPPQLPRA